MYIPVFVLLLFFVFTIGLILLLFLRRGKHRQNAPYSLEEVKANLEEVRAKVFPEKATRFAAINAREKQKVKQQGKIDEVELIVEQDEENEEEEEDEQTEKNFYVVFAHEVKSKNYKEWNLQLRRFCGQGADNYKSKDVAEFREILYKVKEKDVAGWLSNLVGQDIALPYDLKDEAYFIARKWRYYP